MFLSFNTSGPPGTGKTFAASVCSAKLGVPLVSVDVGALIAREPPTCPAFCSGWKQSALTSCILTSWTSCFLPVPVPLKASRATAFKSSVNCCLGCKTKQATLS
ncbi:MAG: AAA family ATPase [Microcoleus sp. PH2017_18_LLB_O_A]|nr:AAA family ATPase [Microcoleus sp. PH2017_18_LLB_O_A]